MRLTILALMLLAALSLFSQQVINPNTDRESDSHGPTINIKSTSGKKLLTGKVIAYVFCKDRTHRIDDEHVDELRYYIEPAALNSGNEKSHLIPLIDDGQLNNLIGADVTVAGDYVQGAVATNKAALTSGYADKPFLINRIISVKKNEVSRPTFAPIRIKRIAIIGAKFTDTTDPMPSVATLQAPFISTPRSLYGYLIDAMRGSVFLQSGPQDIYGWYNINFPSTDCNSNFLAWEDAAAALAQVDAQARGIDLAHDYSHLIFVMPTTTCPFAGSARAGLGVDTPFQLRIIFPLISLEDLSGVVPVMPHEMGHTFGIWNHEGKTNCFGPAGGTCVRQTNGGSGTPMGVSRVIHYSPVEKALLGIIPPDKIQDFGDVSGNTSVVLYPHEWGGKGKQLAIRKIPGTNEWVYVSVNSTSNAGYNMTGGHLSEVHVRIGTAVGNNMQLYLVDATPQTPDNWFDAGLKPGMSMQHTTAPNFSVRSDGIAWSIYGKGVRITFVHNQ
jgi:hypothetical protein